MKIIITESQLRTLVKETTKDRHREGYYKEYNERRKAQGLPSDRHRDGYYEEYNELHPDRKKKGNDRRVTDKNGASKKKDRHRPGYYNEYNKKHPERLNRGFTRGYKDGCVDNGYNFDDAITGFNDDEAFGPGFPNLSDEDYDNAWEYEDGYRVR